MNQGHIELTIINFYKRNKETFSEKGQIINILGSIDQKFLSQLLNSAIVVWK